MAAIIAQWKAAGKDWKWGVKRSPQPFTIAPNRESVILKTKDVTQIMEGVLYPSSALFNFPVPPTTPDVGIRFKTDVYDSEWFFTAYNLFVGGAVTPNHSLYCPRYDTTTNTYAVASDGHWPFNEELEFSLFNRADQPVTVLAYAMWYTHLLRVPIPRRVA